MRRFASLGVALMLAVGTLVPAAHAQQSTGKTVVLGFSQEPDTFVAFESGLYGTQVAANAIYSYLAYYDDVMRPYADRATEVRTLENGGAVMVGEGADQHLETTLKIRKDATGSEGPRVTADDVVWTYKVSLNPEW